MKKVKAIAPQVPSSALERILAGRIRAEVEGAHKDTEYWGPMLHRYYAEALTKRLEKLCKELDR